MAVRAGPEHGRVDAQFLGHVVALDHGPVDHVAGDAHRIAHHPLADHGLDAVGADHGIGLVAAALRVHHVDAPALLRHIGDLGGGVEADQRVLSHGFQDGQVDVGAVDDGIGAAEAGAEVLARIDAHHLAGIDRVHHDDVVGEDGALARAADAQCVQRREGVGAELDARAYLADPRGLFQQLHRHALARERQRRGQAADAAAHHDDRLSRGAVRPAVFMPVPLPPLCPSS